MSKITRNTFEGLKSHTIIRFAAVGVISTATDILLLKLLYPSVVGNIYVATGIAFVAGFTVGFTLNGRYVFKQQHTVTRYAKYGLVSVGALGLTELIVHLLHVDLAILDVLPAKLVAVVLVFFWNYGWSRVWAFK